MRTTQTMRTVHNLNLAAAALVLLLLVAIWSLTGPSGAASGVPAPGTVGCETRLVLSPRPAPPRTGPGLGTLSSHIGDTCPTRPAHTEGVAGR